MILCLDVGNLQIFGGVFAGQNIQLRFRYDTRQTGSSDQMGIFLKTVLRENNIASQEIKKIAICSVVPQIDYSLRAACIKYFSVEPFVLQAGVKTGLKIKYRNPLEVGADRIANAIAAIHAFPNKNIVIADFGTATTLCMISAEKEYLGGVIMPGMRLSIQSLQDNTAKLSSAEIIKPEFVVGRSISESIQSGLYYGQLGMIREIVQRFKQEVSQTAPVVVIGTGGFAYLFEEEQIFTAIMPDLVLHGLRLALELNEAYEQDKAFN